MKKNKFVLWVVFAALLSSVALTSCTPTKTTTYDESGYVGTYIGNHFLADSVTIRGILNDPTAQMIYADTLIITNGTSAADGKLIAKSSLLGGASIEFNITNNNVTPVFIGDVSVLGTVLKSTKLTSGSASWNTGKTILNTQLIATATYNYSGTDIPLQNIRINGQFNKQ